MIKKGANFWALNFSGARDLDRESVTKDLLIQTLDQTVYSYFSYWGENSASWHALGTFYESWTSSSED